MLAFEAGFESGVFPAGRAARGGAWPPPRQKGGVVVSGGKVYVTDGVFSVVHLMQVDRD